MENWRAGLIGVGIVLIGIGGYSSLDGVWKGLSLVAAGIALVLLGLSLERRPRPAVAASTAGEGSAGTSVDDLDATAPMTAVAVEEAEPTAPILRTEPEPEPEPETEPGPEFAMAEEAPPPLSEMAEVQGVAVSANGPVPSDLGDERAHEHDQPMLGHSELVSHIRDYHEGVPFDGSTIQLRLLHERKHA